MKADAGKSPDLLSIFIVDDHTMVRRGLRRILESVEQIRIVGEAGAGLEAVTFVAAIKPDLVLMDISLPGISGIEATRRICQQVPKIAVLMLSMHAEDQYIEQSLAAGARGYLSKDADVRDLIGAVFAVARGEYCVPDSSHLASLPAPPGTLDPFARQMISLVCAEHGNPGITEHPSQPSRDPAQAWAGRWLEERRRNHGTT